MFNNDDNRRLSSDLERMRTDALRSEPYDRETSEQFDHTFLIFAVVLVLVCGAAFYFGLLGIEAGLSMLVLAAALFRARYRQAARAKKREHQVRAHGMKTGDSRFWGRDED